MFYLINNSIIQNSDFKNCQFYDPLLNLDSYWVNPPTLFMAKNLFQKVWDAHAVRELSNGQTQLLIGTHLIHEVTSPQAFGMLRDLGIKVKYPEGLCDS